MNDSNNLIPDHTFLQYFKTAGLTYSVSSRKIRQDIDIIDYLRVFYMYCDLHQIESVFGNTHIPSRLYGGRPVKPHYSLNDDHLARMTGHGIHLALTLTNHFFDEQAYKETWSLLEKHHKTGNAIICTNDELAAHLRKDFPLYKLKASIIKNINTSDKVNRSLDLYDSVTLPMDKNDDDEFLNSLPEKHRIILFANANCAYTCPARTCYLGISQEAFGKRVTSVCSKNRIPRLDMGKVYFNVKKLSGMGFTHFKLVPLAPQGSLEVCRKLSWKKGYLIKSVKQVKAIHYLCSYAKCGRTWLRYILAHYVNSSFKLGMDIDLNSFFSLMPTDDNDPVSGMAAYRHPDDPRFPLIIASHAHYRPEQFATDKNSRVVFLLRSIPDVVVSDYFHRSRFMKSFVGSLKDFLQSPTDGLARYCDYLNSWAPAVQSGQVHVLTYEMLHDDTEMVMADLLKFLGIPMERTILQEAIRLSSFDAMKTVEKTKGMLRRQAEPEDPEAFRMRKGKVGGSVEYLDQEDGDVVRRVSRQLLSDAAKKMLVRFNLWEGDVSL
ncbi:MAG: sulfotransferase domain-containing protein [Desulfobacteraceae bacterium]